MRKYNCKDEELTVMCGYAAFSLKRDLSEFTAFSSKMDQSYVENFEKKTQEANEILNPQVETVNLKDITTRLYANMDSLTEMMNRVKAYMKLAKGSISITPTDFGLTALRRKVEAKDAEGVLQGVKMVQANLAKYKTQLAEQGLSDELIDAFASTAKSIAEGNQQQYEIISKRKALVQQNVSLFNDLHQQLMEICEVGKVFYKGKDALKLQEYTFTELKKRVRIATRANKEEVL